MKIGVVGLGKMGQAVAYRLIKGRFAVIGFDPDSTAREELKEMGGMPIDSVEELAKIVDVVWLMVPAGKIVDDVITAIKPKLKKDAVIIDGGNSHFPDSVRRAESLAQDGISYLDVGTSGGLNGRDIGFSLMVGGEKKVFDRLEPIFEALAAPNGYGYMGPAGAGHYVKMVHNGIEYALLQAYGDGFALLKKNNRYENFNLEEISRVWSNGSVIRSWIMDLAHNVFNKDQELIKVSGKVGGGSTGRWTVQESHEQNIPVPMIEKSLKIRDDSQKTGGNYATKVVAMLRNQFGGHKVEKV
jgi:6-phosphogluconate dehydrogenase